MMTPAEKLKMLIAINERAPETRLRSALHQVAKKDKVEALKLPKPDRRGWLQRFVSRFVEPGAY